MCARQTPADKLARLASLRASGARVVVVGDGMNDAPMLAGADVAVAVGAAADVAQAASDIVITGRLDALADARTLARQMLSILRQNRRWALAYNLAAVPLAALGFVPPWLAAIGMSASSLAVVLNALRIGRAGERESPSARRGARGRPSSARVGMNSLAVPDSAVDPAPRRRRASRLFWAVDHGQFDDMETPALLPMLDADAASPSSAAEGADKEATP